MLYNKYFKIHFQSNMQYRLNTFLITLTQIIVSLGELVVIWVMFKQFKTVGYWGFYETLLMFGIITTVFSFTECFARGYDEFGNLIRRGDLDRLLVRPVNLHFQIFAQKIEFSKLGKVIFGLVISIIAIANLAVSWTFAKVVVLISVYVCGAVIITGIFMLSAGINVFTVDNSEFLNIITNGGKELSYYPINVYKKWLTRLFTFVFPFACFNYLPISFIMGYGSLPPVIYALSPLLGSLFIIPCILFFNWAIRRYQSTGT